VLIAHSIHHLSELSRVVVIDILLSRSEMQHDRRSTFLYEGGGLPDTFSLTELNLAVSRFLESSCQPAKLGEGTWHKVCEVGHSSSNRNHIFNRFTMSSSQEICYQELLFVLPVPLSHETRWNLRYCSTTAVDTTMSQPVYIGFNHAIHCRVHGSTGTKDIYLELWPTRRIPWVLNIWLWKKWVLPLPLSDSSSWLILIKDHWISCIWYLGRPLLGS
jgi:hypothetical protein